MDFASLHLQRSYPCFLCLVRVWRPPLFFSGQRSCPQLPMWVLCCYFWDCCFLRGRLGTIPLVVSPLLFKPFVIIASSDRSIKTQGETNKHRHQLNLNPSWNRVNKLARPVVLKHAMLWLSNVRPEMRLDHPSTCPKWTSWGQWSASSNLRVVPLASMRAPDVRRKRESPPDLYSCDLDCVSSLNRFAVIFPILLIFLLTISIFFLPRAPFSHTRCRVTFSFTRSLWLPSLRSSPVWPSWRQQHSLPPRL